LAARGPSNESCRQEQTAARTGWGCLFRRPPPVADSLPTRQQRPVSNRDWMGAIPAHARAGWPCYGAQARPTPYLATRYFGASQKGIVLLPQCLGLRLRFHRRPQRRLMRTSGGKSSRLRRHSRVFLFGFTPGGCMSEKPESRVGGYPTARDRSHRASGEQSSQHRVARDGGGCAVRSRGIQPIGFRHIPRGRSVEVGGAQRANLCRRHRVLHRCDGKHDANHRSGEGERASFLR
jgi:hypothetical protein